MEFGENLKNHIIQNIASDRRNLFLILNLCGVSLLIDNLSTQLQLNNCSELSVVTADCILHEEWNMIDYRRLK